MRARQNCCDGIAYASFETPVFVTSVVETHQRSQIVIGDRTPECATRQSADDFTGASRLVGFALRPADHNFLATGGVAHAADSQRPTDLQGVRSLNALLTTFKGNRANALVALSITALKESD